MRGDECRHAVAPWREAARAAPGEVPRRCIWRQDIELYARAEGRRVLWGDLRLDIKGQTPFFIFSLATGWKCGHHVLT
jgi:hypothetical protein